jgi:holo-[acyl-carrier protein] synthase
MSVVALGIDLVEVSRIRSLLERNGDRFKERMFLADEVTYCDSCADPPIHYAARFAAKEAVVKALGTGFADGVGWNDVEVLRAANGMPSILLRGGAEKRASEMGVTKVLVTLTHTETAAAASVVLLG